MEFLVIMTCVILAIVVGIILYTRSKRKKETVDLLTLTGKGQVPCESNKSDGSDDLQVIVEPLPQDAFQDKKELVEITDTKTLVQVNALFADFLQAANAVNNAAQAARLGEGAIYRAIIPSGKKLTKSRTMEDAVRGFYQGENGIQGHADFISVDTDSGIMVATNVSAAMLSVASIVVGQYYMDKISRDISKIRECVSQIAEFQDNEYRSKVSSLFVHVMNIVELQKEILENDELRQSKIIQLDNLEMKCTELLDQANLTLEKFSERTFYSYEEYEEKLYDAEKWHLYQKTLLSLLYKIAELKYVFGMGAASKSRYTSIFRGYLNRYKEIQARLTELHEKCIQSFGIELDEGRRKKSGIDALFAFLPGLINDNLNYWPMEENTASMITSQKNEEEKLYQFETDDFYEENIVFIYKGGKIYYLPAART